MARNLHEQTVRVNQDFDGFKKGEVGFCTADLKSPDYSEDIFAVWFREREPPNWITFISGKSDRDVRDYFDVLELDDDGKIERILPATALLTAEPIDQDALELILKF